MFLLEIFVQNLVIELFDRKKIRCKTRKKFIETFCHWYRFYFMFDLDKTNIVGPILSPFCVWWLDAAPKIENHKKVTNIVSVRNCKKCYASREISSRAVPWKPKSTIPHCSWPHFVSNDSYLSPQKLSFSKHVLPPVFTLLKLNYLYLFIINNYPCLIRCVPANQLAGFYICHYFLLWKVLPNSIWLSELWTALGQRKTGFTNF